MVSAETIIDTALRENVDIIGLSGLITPSLEEMRHVASEMQRRGLQQPADDWWCDHLTITYGSAY